MQRRSGSSLPCWSLQALSFLPTPRASDTAFFCSDGPPTTGASRRASPPCALRYEGGAVGTGRLVVPNGDRTRCRSHALASPRGILRLYQFERGGLRYPIRDGPCRRWGSHLGDAPHHRLRRRAHLRMDRPFHSSKSLAERRSALGVRAGRNRWVSAFWYDRIVGPERRVTGERSSPRA